MASKNMKTLAVLLALNVLFFTYVTASPYEYKKTCDALNLGVCGDLLGSLLKIRVGAATSKQSCCSLINGLVDLDAAVCVCTAIKANVLGIVNLNIPLSLKLLLNACGKKVPYGFECP